MPAWGVGQKDKKNGLMLLVAMEERKSRLEVGYGLEPIIPDILAGRILDHQLRPKFREGKYGDGLMAAVNAACELVEKGEPADRQALAAEQDNTFATLAVLTGIALAGSFILGVGWGVRRVSAIFFGILLAGIALFSGAAVAWPLAALIQWPLSLLSMAAGHYLSRNVNFVVVPSSGWPPGGSTWGNYGGRTRGWTSGGGSWSSGGGFSSSWGGFGGGSSGGGGASSGW